ncbi:ABC transporter ATP-binding protein [Desulfonema ishimotonii]|uniref:ABC transporter ATP-binding protein n=1 Tax=Desulfonema ishimotonii TaxID=45657 RepID=A0A401FYP9_9BACT|nr:ABC transporter ATP-binding protein [Desulfonema ishimotonii]GBC62085.1 ABC transporter ATP-binding protein [Desulfonema ishimotonii]
MNPPHHPLIRLDGISKSFGPVQANKNITLDIHAGKIKALLGENGAGKSTLMSILAGRYQPDSGRIQVDGRPTVFPSASAAIRAGVGMVYQHFMLVEAMSVAENVFLGQEGGFWLRPARMAERVAELARTCHLDIDPAARVADLSMGEKQRVEILKLLLRQSRVLIFDEPTAVLTPQEADQLFSAMRRMADQGKAIVFISHKLQEVMDISDDIAILRRGEIVDTMPAGDVTSKTELARRMVGRDVVLQVEKDPVKTGRTVLDIRALETGPLKDISIQLRRGEILGLVGVAGNGQKPLVETICGLSPPTGGTVEIMEKPWEDFFSRYASRDTLSYIPEDRLGLATCPGLDLRDNFLLTTCRAFCRGPWLNARQAEGKAKDLVAEYGVRPLNVCVLARQLSGGNLQKMVLGREFYRKPRLIVAEQPTQGLDIAATEEVWQHLLRAREKAGILLVTGDLSEALALSDRIAVMFDGRIMDVFDANDTRKVEQIGVMMAGISPE